MTGNTHFENAATSLANGGKLAVTPENEAIIYTVADLTEATLAVAYEARTANLIAYEAVLRRAVRDVEFVRTRDEINQRRVRIRNEILERLDRPGLAR